jgi:hypothetical protein
MFSSFFLFSIQSCHFILMGYRRKFRYGASENIGGSFKIVPVLRRKNLIYFNFTSLFIRVKSYSFQYMSLPSSFFNKIIN